VLYQKDPCGIRPWPAVRERMSLWAGQGYRSATENPAAEIIERLSTTGAR
jgi:hypothetical protein